jgi:hypothetical protein
MTRIRRGAVCLVAATAIGAAAATSASAALPGFTGPFPKAFTSTSKTSTLETIGKAKVTCKADTDAGQITGETTGTVTIKFTGCATKGFLCTSPGAAAAGEIVTHPLTSTLGYINRETKEVGIDYSNPAGALLAEFTCGNIVAAVKGSVIGKITPVNKFVIPPGHFTVRFAQKAGKQNITKLAGRPIDILETALNGGPFEPSGLSSTDLIKFAEPVEIKA